MSFEEGGREEGNYKDVREWERGMITFASELASDGLLFLHKDLRI